jgi:hypothetical protein
MKWINLLLVKLLFWWNIPYWKQNILLSWIKGFGVDAKDLAKLMLGCMGTSTSRRRAWSPGKYGHLRIRNFKVQVIASRNYELSWSLNLIIGDKVRRILRCPIHLLKFNHKMKKNRRKKTNTSWKRRKLFWRKDDVGEGIFHD